MNLVVYLNPNYIANEVVGDSVTNISEAAKAAIEVALSYKDSHDVKVSALIVGDNTDETVLREAYAMGVDEMIEVHKEYTAANVAEIIKAKQFDTVVTAESNANEVATALGYSLNTAENVAEKSVVQVTGANVKPRYMHITRVFNAYEQTIEVL